MGIGRSDPSHTSLSVYGWEVFKNVDFRKFTKKKKKPKWGLTRIPLTECAKYTYTC